MNNEVSTLFRRVSPCVRFVVESRVSTRTDCLHGVGHLSRFVGDSPFYRSIAVISIFAHKRPRFILALLCALATAPYVFFIPDRVGNEWFDWFTNLFNVSDWIRQMFENIDRLYL